VLLSSLPPSLSSLTRSSCFWKVLLGPYFVDDFVPSEEDQMRDRS
jgi:hypothetical protein